MKATTTVWVLTFDPRPDVWETARVFLTEDEAYKAQEDMPGHSLVQPAPLTWEVDLLDQIDVSSVTKVSS